VSVWTIRLAINGALALTIDAAFALMALLVIAPFSYGSIHNWYRVMGRSQLFTSQWIQEPSISRVTSI